MADSFRPKVVLSFNKLPELTATMRRHVNALVAKAAFDIEAGAKSRVPVDTGNLKNSIQTTRIGPGHYRITVGASYGVYVEYGTWKTKAQPFFHPAIAAVEPRLRAGIAKVVGQ